jgi:hypothetical protein
MFENREQPKHGLSEVTQKPICTCIAGCSVPGQGRLAFGTLSVELLYLPRTELDFDHNHIPIADGRPEGTRIAASPLFATMSTGMLEE